MPLLLTDPALPHQKWCQKGPVPQIEHIPQTSLSPCKIRQKRTMVLRKMRPGNGIFQKKKNFFKKSEKKCSFFHFFLATNRFSAYIIVSI
jgi:hypothetical protein